MKVLITFRFFDEWVNRIRENGIEIIQWKEEKAPPKKWIMDNVTDVDGILCTLNTRIDKDIISIAKKLKVISTYSVGFDHIDVKEAKSKGIKIGYTPEVLTETTADLIFGLILAVARRIVEGDKLIREGKWMIPWQPDFLLGYDVYGKTLGIIGMGRIGKAVYRRAKGFNMHVIYYSRSKKYDIEAEYVSLDELLQRSDFVVVTVDLNESTYHMINEKALKMMKRNAFLINASRGRTVDEKALVKALEEKWIAGAALDVFEEEPINKDHPLLKFNNVVVTPHIGSATFETRHKMAEIAVENLKRGLRGEKLVYEL
ncbi:2-hydroxyacid dehydrogenase [Stygiolobus caldivivus]|uniref:D-glycerate dehydrogenase n=1 Tax=Stygiolobus caldivivus TaxID=2824673 RepID=A0A8D5U5A6_9CREN|nr:D-glycerate dehydrogenase [Stygiolobus caldivivus]BCU69292.1 D-glycerate dehydrogenase [Stygiolobus caldivivus]